MTKLKVNDKLIQIKRNTIKFQKLKRIPSFLKKKTQSLREK